MSRYLASMRLILFAVYFILHRSSSDQRTSTTMQNTNEIKDALVPAARMWNGDLSCWQRYPFFILIIENLANGRIRTCSGGLITKEVLITAAHCFDKWAIDGNYSRLEVWSRVNNFRRRGGIKLQVRALIRHPSWWGFDQIDRINTDYALLLLNASSFGNAAPNKFLLLPEPYEDRPYIDTKENSTILGMGSSIPQAGMFEPFDRLKEGQIHLATKCLGESPWDPKHMLCAAVEGVKPCPGEYGYEHSFT